MWVSYFFLCIDVANKSDRDVVKKFQRSSGLEKHAYARELEDCGYLERILKVSIDVQIENNNQIVKVSYSCEMDKVLFFIKNRS